MKDVDTIRVKDYSTDSTAKIYRSLSYNCQVLTARHGLSSVILNGGYLQNFPKRGSL